MIDWEIDKAGDGGDVLVFKLTGRLETTESEYLLSVIENRIEEGDSKLVLDCDRLSYLSSLGLGTLVRARARMKKAGGDVKLAGVHGVIASVISAVNLDRIFHLYPTVEAAVASFQT
jgi:anti-sigma B factor antagonist